MRHNDNRLRWADTIHQTRVEQLAVRQALGRSTVRGVGWYLEYAAEEAEQNRAVFGDAGALEVLRHAVSASRARKLEIRETLDHAHGLFAA